MREDLSALIMTDISENSPLMNWVQKKDRINVFFINMVVKVVKVSLIIKVNIIGDV